MTATQTRRFLIWQWLCELGRAVEVKQVAGRFLISRADAAWHVRQLYDAGCVTREEISFGKHFFRYAAIADKPPVEFIPHNRGSRTRKPKCTPAPTNIMATDITNPGAFGIAQFPLVRP